MINKCKNHNDKYAVFSFKNKNYCLDCSKKEAEKISGNQNNENK